MNIFKMEFRRNAKSLFVWSGICAILIIVFMLLYPSMRNNESLQLAKAKLSALPQEVVQAFHMAQVDFTEVTEFFGFVFQFLMTAVCIYATVLGLSALSREESEGTIEFLYSKPVRRLHIVIGKVLSALASFAVYFLIFGAAGIVVTLLVKPAATEVFPLVSTLKSVLLGGMTAGCTYLFMGVLVSAFLRKARSIAVLAVGIFFVTGIVGGIPDALGVLGFLRWISPTACFIPKDIIMNGLNAVNIGVCLGVMALCAAAACIVYQKKDFAV